MQQPKYVVSINGRERTIDKDKFERNLKAITEKYPDATIKAVDKSRRQGTLPLSRYRDAVASGLIVPYEYHRQNEERPALPKGIARLDVKKSEPGDDFADKGPSVLHQNGSTTSDNTLAEEIPTHDRAERGSRADTQETDERRTRPGFWETTVKTWAESPTFGGYKVPVKPVKKNRLATDLYLDAIENARKEDEGNASSVLHYPQPEEGETYMPKWAEKTVENSEIAKEERAERDKMRETTKETVEELLGEVTPRRKEVIKEYKERRAEEWRSNPFTSSYMQSSGAEVAAGRTLATDPEYRSLSAAENLLEDARKIIKQAERNAEKGSTFIGNLGYGLKDGVFDLDTWDMGIGSMFDAYSLKHVIEKYESGRPLEYYEEQLLDAVAVNLATESFFGSEVGRGYKAGKVTAESIPFMLEMIANPASGIGKGLAKSVAKYGIKRFGKVATGAARVVGDILGAATMAGTTSLAAVGADATHRQLGNIRFGVGDRSELEKNLDRAIGTQPRIRYAGRDKTDESYFTSWAKAYGANTIEHFSEMFGAYFSPLGKLMGGSKPMKWLGATKVGQFIDNVSASDVGRTIGSIERQAQWNGTFGEYLEEVAGSVFNTIFIGDSKWSDLTDLDQQIDTFLGVSIMGGFFSAVKTAGYRTPRYSANRNLKKADAKASSLFGDEWVEVREQIDLADQAELRGILVEIANTKELSQDEKEALGTYVRQRLNYLGVLKGEQKKKEERGESSTETGLEAAYAQGQEAAEAEADAEAKQRIKAEYNAAMGQIPQERLEELNAVEDAYRYIEEHPEEAEQLTAYFEAKAKYDGLVDGTSDIIKAEATEAGRQIDLNTHPDGHVYSVVLKDNDHTRAHIVSGDIVLNEEGQIDLKKSGSRVVIRKEKGEPEMRDIRDIAKITAIEDAAQAKGPAIDQLYESRAKEAAEEIDGAPARPEPNSQLTLNVGDNSVEAYVQDPNTPDGTILVQFEEPVDIPGIGRGRVLEMTPRQLSELSVPESAQTQVQAQAGVPTEMKTAPAQAAPELEEGQAVAPTMPATGDEATLQQNQDNGQVGRSLTPEEAEGLLSRMEENAEEAHAKEMTPENWFSEFGEDGRVETPIGTVKMGENQYLKMLLKQRADEFPMIKPTLSDPDIVIEEADRGKNAERESKYLFVKTFVRNGKKIRFYTSVTVSKEGLEVVISNHIMKPAQIMSRLLNGNLLWSKYELTYPEISDESQTLVGPTAQDPSSYAHGSNVQSIFPTNKDTENTGEKQGKAQEFPRTKSGRIDFEHIEDPSLYADALREEFGDESTDIVEELIAEQTDKLEKARNKPNAIERRYGEREAARQLEKLNAVRNILSPGAETVNGAGEPGLFPSNRAAIKSKVGKPLTPKKKKDTDFQRRIKNLGDPVSIEDVIYQDIAKGLRFVWRDNGLRRGLARELGFTGKRQEQMARIKILHSSGITVDNYAERLYEEYSSLAVGSDEIGRENGNNIFPLDDIDIRGIIIDVLLTINSPTKALEAAEALRSNYGKESYLEDEHEAQGRIDAEALQSEYTNAPSADEIAQLFSEDSVSSQKDDNYDNTTEIQRGSIALYSDGSLSGERDVSGLAGRAERTRDAQIYESRREGPDAKQTDKRYSSPESMDGNDSSQRLRHDGRVDRRSGSSLTANHRIAPRDNPETKVLPINSKDELQTSLQNDKFVDENNTEDGSERAEARLDNRGTVGGSTQRETLGRDSQADGIYRTAEAADLAGNDRTVREAEQLEELEARGINPYFNKRNFRKELAEQARANGVWLDASYLEDKQLVHDRRAKGTSEHDVYINPDGKTLTKLNDLSYVRGSERMSNLKAILDRIAAHNALFPDVTYEIKGFMNNKHGFPSLVLEQRRIDAERNATQEEIDRYLQSIGFTLSGAREWSNGHPVWSNGVYELFDARPANVLVGKDGNLYFIDTIPHSVDYMSRRNEANGRNAQTSDLSPDRSAAISNNTKERQAEHEGGESLSTTPKNPVDADLSPHPPSLSSGRENSEFSAQEQSAESATAENDGPILFREGIPDDAPARQSDYDFDVTGITEANAREMKRIKEDAVASGRFMKAPNGKPTKLTERQWLQVRTSSFKRWFGDWEKAARIGKLRKSKPVVVSGEDYRGKYELNRSSAKRWMKDNLRGIYVNKDTGGKIEISKVGVDKVTSHGERDEAHLKSIVVIPQLIEKSVFIEELPNEKGNDKYDSYQYYVCGLKIEGQDYTAKIVIGVKGDTKYYDHRLSQIEKGTLIDNLNGMAKSVAENQSPYVSTIKDSKLLSLLQTNSSKVVDENGEPLVVYHGTDTEFWRFDPEEIRDREGSFFFAEQREDAQAYSTGRVMAVFVNLRNPFDYEGSHKDQLPGGLSSRYERAANKREQAAVLKDAGYDGWLADFGNGNDWGEISVFEPDQIKSATDNDGGFSDRDKDIRFRDGEPQSVGLSEIFPESVDKETLDKLYLQKLKNYAEKIIRGEAIYRRFSDREQAGLARGGRLHVEASLYSQAGAGTGGKFVGTRTDTATEGSIDQGKVEERKPIYSPDGAEDSKANGRDHQTQGSSEDGIERFEREVRNLEAYARARGVWIENTTAYLTGLYGEHKFSGFEAMVWVDGDSVYKSTETGLYGTPREKLDAITLHNTYFPETAMEVIGFGRADNGEFNIVLRQPHIQKHPKIEPTIPGMRAQLIKLGFEPVTDTGREDLYSNDQTIVSDMYPDNAIVTLTGRTAIIDPVMRLNTPDSDLGGKRVTEERIEIREAERTEETREREMEPVLFRTTEEGSADFTQKFNDLNVEYERLIFNRKDNPNFEEDLNQWRDRKAEVVREYLTSLAREYGIESEILVFNSETHEAELPDIIRENLQEWKELQGRAGGYSPDTGHIILDVAKTDRINSRIQYEQTFVHEATHAIIPDLFTEQELENIYNESGKYKGYASVLESYADKNNSEIGEEILTHTIEAFANRGGRNVFSEILLGQTEPKVAIEYIKRDTPLTKQAVLKILNSFRDEKRRQKEKSFWQHEVSPGGVMGHRRTGRLAGSERAADTGAEERADTGAGAASGPTLQERIVETVRETAERLNVGVRIVENVEDITHPNPALEQRQRRARGWYDSNTGEIVVVVPNHGSEQDALATVLHEVVGHYGLRKLLGDRFDKFLDEVFARADEKTKREISRRALRQKDIGNIRLATEEYIAELAEEGIRNPFIHTNGLWIKIREALTSLLSRIGINVRKLTDNDLRYMLWKSYNNLQKHDSIMDRAAKVAADGKIRSMMGYDDVPKFRDGYDGMEDIAQELYEKQTAGLLFKFAEGHYDNLLSLRRLQDAIIAQTGGELKDHENVARAYNQKSSKSTAEWEAFMPMFEKTKDTLVKIASKGLPYEELQHYILAKSGLERNEVFAMRDAQREFDKRVESLDQSLKEGSLTQKERERLLAEYETQREGEYLRNRGDDYSGLTGLANMLTQGRDVTTEEAEALAREIVEKAEARIGPLADELWEDINKMTRFTWNKANESGLLTRRQYEKVRDMFRYYVPMRGFAEDTAYDVWEYVNSNQSPVNSIERTAKGRRSIPDDPLAIIASMAENVILQGNNNKMKQRFLNLGLNHPTSLLTVSKMWYVNNGTKSSPRWESSYPSLSEDMSPEQIAATVEEHEKNMRELAQEGRATQKRQGLAIGYKHGPTQAREHAVTVKVAGVEYIIYVNGNPRAAQAVNGLLENRETDGLKKFLQSANRGVTALMTSKNPEFIPRNGTRDTNYALAAVAVKESKEYAALFRQNLAKNTKSILPLVVKYQEHKLDGSNPLHRMFEEFVMNGGETGYASLHRADHFKKEIEKTLKKARRNKGVVAASDASAAIMGAIETGNRAAEDLTRFTTYMTSRQMGRSVTRSISDAKEITSNFNTHGSGAMGADWLKTLFFFYNPSIQGLINLAKLFKTNPTKAVRIIGGRLMIAGAVGVPLLNMVLAYALDGDDDEYKKAYGDLTDYIRQKNACIYIGSGKFLTIPLAQGMRFFYGTGETINQTIAGNRKHKNLAVDVISLITDELPINIMGDNNELIEGEWDEKLLPFTPSLAKPVYEAVLNRTFYGAPIYRNNSWNEDEPGFTKAYAGTPKFLVEAAQAVNAATGGNKYSKGALNINPAVIYHLAGGYAGGPLRLAGKVADTAESLAKGELPEVAVVPVMSVFLQNAGRFDGRLTREMYEKLETEYRDTDRLLKKYKSDGDMAEEYRKLLSSPRFERMLRIAPYQEAVEQYRKALKTASGDSAEELKKQLNMILQLAVDELYRRDSELN